MTMDPNAADAGRDVRRQEELVGDLLGRLLYLPADGDLPDRDAVPTVDDPADVRYPVLVEGGRRLVPVFTSEARVRAALADPPRPYVAVPGDVLLAGWPSDAALYLDPGDA